MIIKILVCATLLLTLLLSAHAGKEYTPQQLHQMVAAGKFPPQGDPGEETKRVAFSECKVMVRSVMAAAQPNYPVRTLLEQPTVLSMKLWANDGAVVMSCSHDDRLVVQNSSYR